MARKTPVIVSSEEAKRWATAVNEFGDFRRVKYITSLEQRKKFDTLASAEPSTVLRHAVDISQVRQTHALHT